MLFDKAEDSGSELVLLVDAGWCYSQYGSQYGVPGDNTELSLSLVQV